ncbi:flagellar biosynthesis protein FlhA [Vampirovibrio chlorellavorus]|uniref:flagellar biosynthesis protein FlhA n=1 Tax=Vampirovibrio chlorellavorus TaxID=758823 RepID=UPI0026EB8E05|nr:flagellar biosynthesis protein FlhA [Vampirovibrio chlorellavorus]
MSAPNKKMPRLGWKDLLKHNDVLLAVGIVFVVTMMVIPLSPLILDVFLTLNIALSVTILLVTLYTQEPLQYSTFPTILLFATLFRLGLNVSTTRLILLNGEAGQVVHAFGNFVIGGNYVVGMLIFIILIIINFIVITNGAGRVSEVAARFTLDAMPGKQLSIDADLNAGMIDEKEAKRRRQNIQREADFYGTMDGASKFVKGDAIAAIIITVINIVGGLIIGVMQMGMPLEQAAATFTTLSVGDGLVSQLPALIISAATGILVTRVNDSEVSLGDEIGGQMFQNPKVMAIMGSLMLLMGMIPGLPNLPFLTVGALAVGGSFLLVKNTREKAEMKLLEDNKAKTVQKKKTTTENVLDLLQVETMELEIGYRLVPLIEAEAGGDLLERIAQIRKQVALEFGFVLPSIRVRDNLQLPPNQYNIKLRGVTIDQGEVMADLWLAMSTDPDIIEPIQGIETKEPAFGLPALWIEADEKEQAEMNGYTVVSASAVVSTHLTEFIKKNSADILGRADVQNLLTNVKKSNESLVTDLVPDTLTEAEIQIILQNLLREKVSIRDMVTILESLGYHCRVNKDPDYLTEQVRMALSRSICKQHQNPDTGELPVLTLDPTVEEQMAQGLTQDGQTLALGPVFTQKLFAALNQEIERVIGAHGVQPVLLCNARLRLPFRRMIERMLPQIAVLSYNEIGPSVKATAVGSVRVDLAQLA